MKNSGLKLLPLLVLSALLLAVSSAVQAQSMSPAARESDVREPVVRGPGEPRPRVIVSTDIGGTDPAAAEGVHAGAKSVNRWREAFLKDFAARMRRLVRQSQPEP